MTRVLVADDDQPTRDTIRYVLEDAGYQMTEAGDGQAALAALRNAPGPLIVLLDLLMPRMNGLDLLRAINGEQRLVHRHRYICMTAASASMTPEATELLAPLHGTMLAKPFSMDALLQALEAARATLPHEGPDDGEGAAQAS